MLVPKADVLVTIALLIWSAVLITVGYDHGLAKSTLAAVVGYWLGQARQGKLTSNVVKECCKLQQELQLQLDASRMKAGKNE